MRHLTVKETAAALRARLKTEFPRAKFSVVMSRGSGYGWLSVSWVDGPTTETVDAIVGQYESERFSGMDDGYHPTGATVEVKGETVIPNCCGANTSRSLSPAALDWAREQTGHTGYAAMYDIIQSKNGEHPVVLQYPSNEEQALAAWLRGQSFPS